MPWHVPWAEWELGIPAGVAVWVNAHLSCSEDVGGGQVSLYQYDWLRRLMSRYHMGGGWNCYMLRFQNQLPVRPSKFPFPFDFKNCIVRETDLCCGLKLIRFDLRLWILLKLLPVAAERTGYDFYFFFLYSCIFGGRSRKDLGDWLYRKLASLVGEHLDLNPSIFCQADVLHV